MSALWGKEHPDTLTSVHNLASLLKALGKLDEAEPLYRWALEARERTLGKEHPDTLTSVNNLALLLQDMGKLDGPSRCRRALEARERALGKEHPSTLRSVSNLASLLQDMGKLDEAEVLYRRALEAFERTLGKEHHYAADFCEQSCVAAESPGQAGRGRAALQAGSGGKSGALLGRSIQIR